MSARAWSESELILEARRREIPITNARLLRQALTHKSLVPDAPLDSNERLEFLGDAVLSQIVALYLFQEYPKRGEGELAKARSLIVCKSALAAAARRMDIVPLVLLGATEEALGGRARASLIADAYEALLAVVYLEHGVEEATRFVLRTLAPEIDLVRQSGDWRDPKTILQEMCQADKSALPVYRIIAESGKPHDRTFTAEVLLNHAAAGVGVGKTKKDAEQAAAVEALSRLELDASEHKSHER